MEKLRIVDGSKLASHLEPHLLIRQALADMAVQREKGVKIHMDDWVVFDDDVNKVCSVCMAGAVMEQSLGGGWISPASTKDPATSHKLRALDCFRQGSVLQGLFILKAMPQLSGSFAVLQRVASRRVVRFTSEGEESEQRFKAFVRSMELLADELEKLAPYGGDCSELFETLKREFYAYLSAHHQYPFEDMRGFEMMEIGALFGLDKAEVEAAIMHPPAPEHRTPEGTAGPYENPWDAVEAASSRLFMKGDGYVFWIQKPGHTKYVAHYSHRDLQVMHEEALRLASRLLDDETAGRNVRAYLEPVTTACMSLPAWMEGPLVHNDYSAMDYETIGGRENRETYELLTTGLTRRNLKIKPRTVSDEPVPQGDLMNYKSWGIPSGGERRFFEFERHTFKAKSELPQ